MRSTIVLASIIISCRINPEVPFDTLTAYLTIAFLSIFTFMDIMDFIVWHKE